MYAHGTTHYNLPLTSGEDTRDWFDTNQAFEDVDSALWAAKQDAEGAKEDLTSVKEDVASLQTEAAAEKTRVDTVISDVSALSTVVIQQGTDIGDVKQDLEDMICPTQESSATASVEHAQGSYFIYNDTLYVADELIAVGDLIVPDTNCHTTSVVDNLGGGGTGSEIDDNSISLNKTWSSYKINQRTDVKIGDVRFSGGRIQAYDGHDWVNVPMGGGDTVKIDFSRVLHTVSSNNDTFTINEDGWLFFTGGGTTTVRTLAINGNVVFTCGKSGFTGARSYAGNFHVSSGDTITATNMSEEGDSHVTVFGILES